MLELNSLSVGYGKQTILQNVSAVLDNGTLTCVVGANGCGKSTLLKSLAGILPIINGTISVDSVSLDDMNRKTIAKHIAYLAQGKSTPDMTVEQLVLHGRFPHLHYPRRYSAQDRDVARCAMERTGIADLAQKPLSALSGGMQQNAYLAMALAQDTAHILLDEPTTYLDIAHQLQLMKTLRELSNDGKTVVAVMHDLPLAMTFSDRIVVIADGRMLMYDTPSAVYESHLAETLFGVTLAKSDNSYHYHY